MSGGRLQGFAAARIALLAGLALTMTLASPVTAHAQPRQDTSRGGNNAGDDETQRRARTRLELASAYYAEGRLDTALEEIKGFEEQVGKARPKGDSYSRDFRGPNWLDVRKSAAAYADPHAVADVARDRAVV